MFRLLQSLLNKMHCVYDRARECEPGGKNRSMAGFGSRLMPSRRLAVAAILAALLIGASAAAEPMAGGTSGASGVPAGLKGGKQLYRKYCGQCHALAAALAAGFGSDKGLGLNGGPSFNNLRVPFNLSIVAVTTPFAGHEVVFSKLTWNEVNQVAKYVAVVTKNHPALAQPIDD